MYILCPVKYYLYCLIIFKLQQLEEIIEVNRKFINESQLGTNQSVAAFINILNVVLRAEEEDIIHILKDERNEPIL